jgi:hypothetical protein
MILYGGRFLCCVRYIKVLYTTGLFTTG